MESASLGGSEISTMSRLVRWLTTAPAKRYAWPGLVAYYWTSGTPKACEVGNISSSGMYIRTDEPWLPGSVLPMTLQPEGEDEAEDWIAVLTRIVWSGPDGFGLAFVFSGSGGMFGDAIPAERVADTRAVKRFLKRQI
jgi:hypothetical protein